MTRPGIVLVLSGFPRQSETFALAEVLALEAHGLVAAIFATKPGDGQPPQPDFYRLKTPVRQLSGETTVAQAEALVVSLGRQPIAGLHGYFAHFPAEVAEQAARRLGVPFGFSAHALDVRKVARGELARRARQAVGVVVCNEDTAAVFEGQGLRVSLVRHGVDVQRFYPRAFPSPGAISDKHPLQILAAGRLVEKKGFTVLIQALAQLDVPFRLRLIGDGPMRDELAKAIRASGRAEWIELASSQTHADLPPAYAGAHVVVVPSVVDHSGDRDGLPNVVLEAMASGRPVVASDVGAMRSGVRHAVTGLLVPPGEAAALAQALNWLARQPQLMTKFGRRARAQIETEFDGARCADEFCNVLAGFYLSETQPATVAA